MSDLYGRTAYLNIADELWPLDPPGPATRLEDLDPEWVAGARTFAELHQLPWPPLDGVDRALERCAEAGRPAARWREEGPPMA